MHEEHARTPDYWRRQPTMESGQFDDLVWEDHVNRIWVSRMTRADGAAENKHVTVERLVDGRWVTEAESKGNRWARGDGLGGLGQHMVPELWKGTMYVCELHGEPGYYPADMFSKAQAAKDCDADVSDVVEETGWWGRYTAPGYMDATSWTGPYATKKEAEEELQRLYGNEEGDELEGLSGSGGDRGRPRHKAESEWWSQEMGVREKLFAAWLYLHQGKSIGDARMFAGYDHRRDEVDGKRVRWEGSQTVAEIRKLDPKKFPTDESVLKAVGIRP